MKAALVTWVKGVVYHPCPGPERKARLSFLFSCFPFKCLQCDSMHCCSGARDGGAIWLCACVCLAPLIWPFLTGSLWDRQTAIDWLIERASECVCVFLIGNKWLWCTVDVILKMGGDLWGDSRIQVLYFYSCIRLLGRSVLAWLLCVI